MTFKINPDKLIDYLTAYFPLKRNAVFAWGNVMSAYLGLPGLVGFWPMSCVGPAGEAMDIAGGARHLTNNGTVSLGNSNSMTFNAQVGSTPRYFSRTDEVALSITGTEAHIATSDRGLTMGCWIKHSSNVTGTSRTIMGKWQPATNNRSYALQINTSQRPIFMISDNGTNVYQIISSAPLSGSVRYQFVCGRFETLSTDEIHIFVSKNQDLSGRQNTLEKTTNSTSIPASIYDSTADFTIGAEHGGTNPLISARISLAFLCATGLPDATIGALYQLSRPLFKQSMS